MDLPTLSWQSTLPAKSVTGHARDDSAIVDMDVDSDSGLGASLVGGKGNDEGALRLEDEDNGVLKPDLGAALDFGERSYFYGERLPEAPNPCLNIEGLGFIGLPLGPRDAKAIIYTSSSGGYIELGSGIWELEGAKVKFENPAWATFMGSVLEKACEVLGAKSSLPPQCELSKLYLYEAGSRILPQKDSSEAFATFTVMLPSKFTGGDVHVSHATSSKILDSATLFSSAVFAWYTGVTYEMFPITSGYCLALIYSLTHAPESSDPRPEAPTLTRGLKALHHTLQGWHHGTYKRHSKIAVRLLKHKYSQADLRLGERVLKAEDAFCVANVKFVAEQLGYMVILANMTYLAHGVAEFGQYYTEDEARRLQPSASWEGLPTTSITLEDLVDLNGNQLLCPKPQCAADELAEDNADEPAEDEGGEDVEGNDTQIFVHYKDLIPCDPFVGDSDKSEYEYTADGGRACYLKEYYYRTVMALVHEDDASKILFSQAGVYFALQKLSQLESCSPMTGDRELAQLVLKYLNTNDRKTPNIMAHVAVKWNDLILWKTVVEKSDMLISTFGVDVLTKAHKSFAFEDIRPTFEALLSETMSLGECLGFLSALVSDVDLGSDKSKVTRQWAREQTKLALQSCSSPVIEDAPALATVACVEGVTYYLNEISPQLRGPLGPGFYCALVKSLWESKPTAHTQTLPQDEPSKRTAGLSWLVEECLDKAVSSHGTVPSRYNEHRTVEIIKICLLTGHMAPCRKLFGLLLSIQGLALEKFKSVYCRLVPPLRELLSSKNIDICSPPFIDLFRILIMTYLRDILASKPDAPAEIRGMGCACAECKPLDDFLLQTKESLKKTFKYKTKSRNHVLPTLNAISDLIKVITYSDRSPHTLVITKLPDFVATLHWETRVTEAKVFLNTIGEDEVIAKVMGSRYEDVLKAIQGVQRFVSPEADTAAAIAAMVLPSSEPSSPGLDASGASSSKERTIAPPVGTKRKRTST